MKTKLIAQLAAAVLVAASAACSDRSPTAATAATPPRPRLDTTTTQYRDFDCYYERGGDIWVGVDTWARDVTTHDDSTVTYGEPYWVSHYDYDTGPTAGVGNMSCDQYDGTNF